VRNWVSSLETNAAELPKIRQGELNLDELIIRANKGIEEDMDALFDKSDLPNSVEERVS
jgi:hypothetical protein